jgi:3-hydroxyisobutyrate dehydrogenase-like beta-hydroxyacid dehydrogenase
MAGEVMGFIGLGVMGGPMSANLVKAGFRVVGFDTDERRRSEAEAAGVGLARSCAEVARAAGDIVVSVVRTWQDTEVAVFGPDGFGDGCRSGQVLVVMSTLDPSSMGRLAKDLAAQGVTAVDAPVSGGRAGAENATLSIMASGPADVLDRVRALLDAMGSNVYVVGDRPGMGQAAKLANQLMLGVNMLGAYEGLAIAKRHGVDEDQLMELLSVSTGGSWVTKNWDRIRTFWRDPQTFNDLAIITKDLRSALKEGDEQELSMPVTGVVFQRLHHVWESRSTEADKR